MVTLLVLGGFEDAKIRHLSSQLPASQSTLIAMLTLLYSILVLGAKNSGKTSLIDFLKTSLSLPPTKRDAASPQMTTADGNFTSHFIETEIDNERVGLTIWDSQGLEKNLVDLQLREMATFIESKFEDTFNEEQKVMRSPGVRDTHIHCVFLVLDPVRLDAQMSESKKFLGNNNAFAATQGPSSLDEDLDLQAMRALSGKTTIIPIISKADTLTSPHMAFLKRTVWNTIQTEKLDPLEALGLEESDEEDFEVDSEDGDSDSSDMLPIQSGNVDSPTTVDAREDLEDSSDIIDTLADRSSTPARKITSSNNTTPSPNQLYKQNASAKHNRVPSSTSASSSEDLYIPFSILTPDPYTPTIPGRQFPWGMADPHNPSHCDFLRLRDSVFAEWRTELRTAAREKWYENWRTSRLKRTPQRIRQAGGVTPVGVVPREGRSASGGRQSSVGAQQAGGGLGAGAGYSMSEAVRTVSSTSGGKAERMMGSPRGIAGSAF